jgi:16S rRNA (cytidine1402-2'-O)-methyltransferase
MSVIYPMAEHPTNQQGILFLVATPLGNLEDLAPRALRILMQADLILAEDTRSFGVLKKRFAIETKAISYHDHNEATRTPQLLSLLKSGQTLAMVSEAGTPTISDPGYRLVSACHEQGITVSTVPGPCAAVAALSISGFETHAFTFEGFLPQKSGKKGSTLREALDRPHPTIFYESPHRLIKTLELLAALDSKREIFVARELTKLHEETLRGTSQEILASLHQRPQVKGEIVLIVRGITRKP